MTGLQKARSKAMRNQQASGKQMTIQATTKLRATNSSEQPNSEKQTLIIGTQRSIQEPRKEHTTNKSQGNVNLKRERGIRK